MGEAKRRASLPSLRDWLATMIPSRDAAERDDLAAFTDWAARMLELKSPDNPREAMALRMVNAISIAIIETSNYSAKLGTETADIVSMTARSLGVSFGYSLMSLTWNEDAPIRDIVRPMREEFSQGLKFAIDECLRQQEEPERSEG